MNNPLSTPYFPNENTGASSSSVGMQSDQPQPSGEAFGGSVKRKESSDLLIGSPSFEPATERNKKALVNATVTTPSQKGQIQDSQPASVSSPLSSKTLEPSVPRKKHRIDRSPEEQALYDKKRRTQNRDAQRRRTLKNRIMREEIKTFKQQIDELKKENEELKIEIENTRKDIKALEKESYYSNRI